MMMILVRVWIWFQSQGDVGDGCDVGGDGDDWGINGNFDYNGYDGDHIDFGDDGKGGIGGGDGLDGCVLGDNIVMLIGYDNGDGFEYVYACDSRDYVDG